MLYVNEFHFETQRPGMKKLQEKMQELSQKHLPVQEVLLPGVVDDVILHVELVIII